MTQISPQFHAVLKRKEFSNSRDLLLLSYKISADLGGMKEQGFEREQGVSYNPRPARLTYILIKDCNISCPITLAAAIICSVQEVKAEALSSYKLPNEVLSLCAEAKRSIHDLVKCSREAKIIAQAVHLDRARHLHQSNLKNDADELQSFLRQTQDFIELGTRETLPCTPHLQHWLKRASRWSANDNDK